MKLPRRTFLQLAAGAATLPAGSRIASAQSYPARPVRMIVPYAPGGPTDVFARLIAQKLTENLGRQFFVENIGGAGGNIGMGRGAKADRDGHTIVLVATPLVINPSLYGTVPYDPIKDFDPVTLAFPRRPSSQSTRQCRRKPPVTLSRSSGPIPANKLFFAGNRNPVASPGRIVPAVAQARSCARPVQQRGLGDRLDARGAHSALLRHAAPGIAAPQRRQAARACGHQQGAGADAAGCAHNGGSRPSGYRGRIVVCRGGSGRNPKEIIALLNREIVKIMALPDIKEHLATLGFDSIASSPEEFGERIRADFEKWGKVIRAANIKAD